MIRRAALMAGAVVALAACHGPPDAVEGGPIDPNLAVASEGGYCHVVPLNHGEIDEYEYVNPEWASITDGPAIDADPVYLHGTVMHDHGDTGGDFPGTHVTSDFTGEVIPDPADAYLVGPANEEGRAVEIEWEWGSLPDWAWPGPGDRVVALGRWIWDCGHPDPEPGHCSKTSAQECWLDEDCGADDCPACQSGETCEGTTYHYSSEMHPPQAMATIRLGQGGVVAGMAPAPIAVTAADVFVSPDGGGAGDRCILQHVDSSNTFLFATQCFPLSQPIAPVNAVDFAFDLPLPPRPAGAVEAVWTVTPRATPGGHAAAVDVTPVTSGDAPHLAVVVRMTKDSPDGGGLPTGWAGSIVGGWRDDVTPLDHLRVTVTGVDIHNPLRPVTPVVREQKSWDLNVAVNGRWVRLGALGVLDDVEQGEHIATSLTWDVWLPPGVPLTVAANGVSRSCVDSLMGHSIADSVSELGLLDIIACIQTQSPSPGVIDDRYDSHGGATGTHATRSQGGNGGVCMTPGEVCLTDDDCDDGSSCMHTGGAYSLDYTVESVTQ